MGGLWPEGVTAPGPWFHLALVPPGLWLLWSSTEPGGAHLAGTLLAGFVLLVAPVLWLIRLLRYTVHRRPVRSWAWWLVAPVGGLALVGLLGSDLALSIRFGMSRDAFEAAVDADAPRSGPIGSYVVEFTELDGDDTYFGIGSFSFTTSGFAHLPDGPGDRHGTTYEHVTGEWYMFTSSIS